MRAALITREVGSSVYWVEFKEDGVRVGSGRYCYITRWGARRAANRWVRKRVHPFREEVTQ